MKLQTQIPLTKAHDPLDYESSILMLGSCFSEHIGKKLNFFKFASFQNPFGILFHPLAVETLLEKVVQKKEYTSKDIFEHEGVWRCFDAHSRLNQLSSELLVDRLNQGLEHTHAFLQNATHICITLGTAWVHQHPSREKPVANCHKIPQDQFIKRLLSPDELSKSLENCIKLVDSFGKSPQIIFTISPVRHIKDGFVENQNSKAHLLTALHQVLSLDASKGATYFPSYEIVMDELRDYRFYEKDMVHPNTMAVDYIWEKFRYAWISESAYPVMERVETIQKALAHKPFNPDSEAHKRFLKEVQTKIEYLQESNPTINFDR